MFDSVRKNRFGYYELAEKPDSGTLQRFYAETYFPKSEPVKYTPEEIQYRNNVFSLRYQIIDSRVQSRSLGRQARMLDVGCGEGWAMRYFLHRGWDIFGVDYNEYAIAQNCPECLDHFVAGNVHAVLEDLARKGQTFDCIWLDNVLEHVLEPLELAGMLKGLLSDFGVLMVEVPNDFSIVQRTLWEEGMIDRPYWVRVPDHINYFSLDGLDNLMEAAGFIRYRAGCDYPIDLDLFNEQTNYVKNPGVGRSSHRARLKIENMLHRISLEKTADLYETMAEMGLGRNITGYYTKSSREAGKT
jgi:2-polyprenyl-3-methyl-5-hydroxy-6-metoxy-1,4-benzoquinol methylase